MSRPARPGRPVVVGVDGSPGSFRAAGWAAREAVQAGAALHLVDVSPLPLLVTAPYGSVPYVCEPEQLEEASRAVLGEAESRIRRDLGSTAPRMEQVTVAGPATELLVEASSGGQLLVVGARGLGGFARLVLGSTSSGCIHRAEVPVVVVGGAHQPSMGSAPVVVGVDDSKGAQTALRWAATEAARWDVELVVAHGWETPYAVPPGGLAFTELRPKEFEAHADRIMDHMIEEAFAATGVQPRHRRLAVQRTAAQAVLEVAEREDAALLVVGSRGRGGFAGALLGSVSQQCAHHADRPFAVVRSGVLDLPDAGRAER